MDFRPATSPNEFTSLSTAELRERFLVQDLFQEGRVTLVGTDEDRLVIGGVVLTGVEVRLEAPSEFAADSFCAGRELAIVGLEGTPEVLVDGKSYRVSHFDVLYVGRGSGDVVFSGEGRLYLVSAPAHRSAVTTLITRDEATRLDLGDANESNVRTIRKYIHEAGADSAQLVLGITELAPGSVWNTMPAHVHTRRTEIYLYTGLAEGAQVVHLAGHPQETRNIMVGPDEAVISPNWSLHTGAGTSNYAFVWAMAGENKDYTDFVTIPVSELR